MYFSFSWHKYIQILISKATIKIITDENFSLRCYYNHNNNEPHKSSEPTFVTENHDQK